MINFIIYGIGISGIATAKFLVKNFTNKKILITDDNLEKLKDPDLLNLFNQYPNVKIIFADLIDVNQIDNHTKIIFSPGIPLYFPNRHPILKICQQTNAELVCDIELFYQLNPDNNFIGITGTNGKSTTTALINFVLKNLMINCDLGGNIGIPCFNNNNKINHNYIFETSSYQLDLMSTTRYHIANLLNITPDHIDRHGSMENYINSKRKIFNNQLSGDYSIINIDNQYTQKIYLELKNNPQFKAKIIAISNYVNVENSVCVINNILFNNIDNHNISLPVENFYLKGQHNQQNIAFAFASIFCLISKFNKYKDQNPYQLSQLILNQINLFKGLEHRMQFVKKIDSINFINDSKATNAESTENALKSFENIYWIVGGRAKEGGISILKPYLNKIIKAYLIGESSETFAKFFEQNNIKFEKCEVLENAIQSSYLDAKKNNLYEKNILLSPACASLDQWKNFEERGNFFCEFVKKL